MKHFRGLAPVVKANAQWRYYLESRMYDEAVSKGVLPNINGGFPLKLLRSVRNARPNYLEHFWALVNWKFVAANLAA